MYFLNYSFLISVFCIVIAGARRSPFGIDERYVCTVKTSCFDCLMLSQCSWCATEKTCFSKTLPKFQDFCSNNATNHKDYGLSIEENAECSCSSDVVEQRCFPPGVTDGPECSGRGSCVCGRCVCSVPDPKEPTKVVMGEYCEYDNFSCDDPKCNEGPYLLNSVYDTEIEIPTS